MRQSKFFFCFVSFAISTTNDVFFLSSREQQEPVLKFRNHRPVTESLSKKQLPVKAAPSVAIAKELEKQVKEEIQNKVRRGLSLNSQNQISRTHNSRVH